MKPATYYFAQSPDKTFVELSDYDTLTTQLKIAQEALEFYAEVNSAKSLGSWDMRKAFIFDVIQEDDCDQAHYENEKYKFGGKRARQALKRLRELG